MKFLKHISHDDHLCKLHNGISFNETCCLNFNSQKNTCDRYLPNMSNNLRKYSESTFDNRNLILSLYIISRVCLSIGFYFTV
jgi:hypothetical protein